MSVYDGQVPGPIIEEVQSGDRPITGVGIDTAAFLVETLKGPIDKPVLIKDFSEFTKTFGAYTTASYGAYSVDAFFKEAGKGNRAFVQRLIHRTDQTDQSTYDAVAAAVMLEDIGPFDTLEVQADSVGAWASSGTTALAVVVTADPQHAAASPGSDFAANIAAGDVEVVVVSKKGLHVGSVVKFDNTVKVEYRVLTEVSSAIVSGNVEHTIKWATPLWYAYTTAAPSTLESQEFKIKVLQNGVEVEVGAWSNLTMLDGDARYAETIINDADLGSDFIFVVDQDSEVLATGNIAVILTLLDGDTVTLFAGTYIARTFTARTAPTLADEFAIGGSPTISRNNLKAVIDASGLPVTTANGPAVSLNVTVGSPYGSVANILMTESTTALRFTVAGFTGGSGGLGEDNPTDTAPNSVEPLISGSNGSAIVDADVIGDPTGRTGLYSFDGYRVNVIAAPGQSSAAVIASGAIYAEGRIEVAHFVADLTANLDRDAVVTFIQTTLGADSTKLAVMTDWVYVFDPIGTASNPKKAIPSSGMWMGVQARVHSLPTPDGGPWQVGAGSGIYGKIKTSLGRLFGHSDNDIGEINVAGGIGIRNLEGFGDMFWGARMPTSNLKLRYVNKRTALTYIELSILDGTIDLTFKNNEIAQNRLGKRIMNRINTFLSNMRAAGGLAGEKDAEAFFVTSDSTTTTQTDVDDGVRITNIGVALQAPGEFLVFRLRQIAPGQQTVEEG